MNLTPSTMNMNKILDFAAICAAFLAVIGGTAYLFYDHHILFGVTNILLAVMAFPFIRERFKDLLK